MIAILLFKNSSFFVESPLLCIHAPVALVPPVRHLVNSLLLTTIFVLNLKFLINNLINQTYSGTP